MVTISPSGKTYLSNKGRVARPPEEKNIAKERYYGPVEKRRTAISLRWRPRNAVVEKYAPRPEQLANGSEIQGQLLQADMLEHAHACDLVK